MKRLWNLEAQEMHHINEEEIKNNLTKEIAFINENNIARVVMKHQGKFFQIPQLWQHTA
ncbi:MAG: hypothetical protein GX357_03725 [Firmicutes bacterium]|nr:hypothetical protein [Bacillota bacterium]